jgi:hypothetical protein
MGNCCAETRKSIKKEDTNLVMDQFRPRNYNIKVNGKVLEKNE